MSGLIRKATLPAGCELNITYRVENREDTVCQVDSLVEVELVFIREVVRGQQASKHPNCCL